MARSDATAITGARASSTRHLPLTVPANGWRRRQQYFRSPLPDRSVIELKGEAVGRIQRAHVHPVDPNMARIVFPGSGRDTHVVYDIELPAICVMKAKP